MNLSRSALSSSFFVCALACGTPSSGDEGAGSSSSADGSTTMPPTTSASSGPTTTSTDTTVTTSADGSSSDDAGSSDGAGSSDDAGSSDGGSSDESTGGKVNDCTDVDDPCVLELDTAAAGRGGVDQFFVYTVGDGNEHVQFTGIAGDYVNWDATPGGFLCNLMGPCCLSDGATTCDKPLLGQGVDFAPDDTVYVYVYANAAYELTITSG